MVRLYAYVHDDTAAKLRAHARASDRSLAGELRRALRLYVEMLDRSLKEPGAGADSAPGGSAFLVTGPSPANDRHGPPER